MPLQLNEVLFLTKLQNFILLLKFAQHCDMCFQCCLDVLDALPKSVIVLVVAQNAEQHCHELVAGFFRVNRSFTRRRLASPWSEKA